MKNKGMGPKLGPDVPILGPCPILAHFFSQYGNTSNPLPDGPAHKIGQHEPLTRHTARTTTCLSTSWYNNYLNRPYVSNLRVYTILSISLSIDAQFAKATFTGIVRLVMLIQSFIVLMVSGSALDQSIVVV